jgi:hypothetical protein
VGGYPCWSLCVWACRGAQGAGKIQGLIVNYHMRCCKTVCSLFLFSKPVALMMQYKLFNFSRFSWLVLPLHLLIAFCVKCPVRLPLTPSHIPCSTRVIWWPKQLFLI